MDASVWTRVIQKHLSWETVSLHFHMPSTFRQLHRMLTWNERSKVPWPKLPNRFPHFLRGGRSRSVTRRKSCVSERNVNEEPQKRPVSRHIKNTPLKSFHLRGGKRTRNCHYRDLGGQKYSLTMASGNYRRGRVRPKGPMWWKWPWIKLFSSEFLRLHRWLFLGPLGSFYEFLRLGRWLFVGHPNLFFEFLRLVRWLFVFFSLFFNAVRKDMRCILYIQHWNVTTIYIIYFKKCFM